MIYTITGPMHSDKSEALIRLYNKIYNKNCVLVFKPKIDTRDLGYIKSKATDETIEAICIETIEDILSYVTEETNIILIDEIQFLTGRVKILHELSLKYDIDIYCAGLSLTSEQEPFGIMPEVLAYSTPYRIESLTASCNDCGREANYTFHVGNKDNAVEVGDTNYLCLCDKHLRKRRLEDKTLKLVLKKKEPKE
jgi:thymidine kinase